MKNTETEKKYLKIVYKGISSVVEANSSLAKFFLTIRTDSTQIYNI